MSERVNELTVSYYRCNHSGEFLDTFYDLFLSTPAIALMFANTDLKIQKLMLRQSLLEMICFDLGIEGTREEIERLGRRHKELGIMPEMYTLWLDALCEAIGKHDECYTPELGQLWRNAMLKSIETMLAVDAD